MEVFNKILSLVTTFLWDYILLIVLVGAGIFFTIRLRFVQVTKMKQSFADTFGKISFRGKKAGKQGMSSFQALATAIAAQIGTGNLVGAATAITLGGAGSIFWMWVSGFFGMATIFSEATLAQQYKCNFNGEIVGGPVYYIKQAFQGKFGKVLAGIFAVLIIFALGFMGNMVQTNSVSNAFHTAIPAVPNYVFGIVIAIIAGFVFFGGVRRIASFSEKVVPIMAVLYVIGAIVVLCFQAPNLGTAIGSIFVGAFQPQAVVGGICGATILNAMRYGVARGLFSNEAGMGSTPHAHALAKVKHPCDQGVVAMMGVFIDTFVVLTITALVLLSSGVINQPQLVGIDLVQAAFSNIYGVFGNYFIAICLFFFAFTTIIGWYFFGAANVKYLFGKRAVKIYACIVMLFLVAGSLLKLDLVWTLSDLFNGLMVIPNIIALIALSRQVSQTLKQYNQLKKSGEYDTFVFEIDTVTTNFDNQMKTK